MELITDTMQHVKKYVLIQNEGEIESNAFELIGASTKRNDKGKIGFFGSGLKYSIAYMLRNNIDFKIYSGLNELKFTTTPESFRGQTFDRICIDGRPTSYTVTMGPTWTKDWFVLREIYCNALDEGSFDMVKSTEHIAPIAGMTRIYIGITEALNNVIENWDAYFSSDRMPILKESNIYTSFLSAEVSRQDVLIYEKTNGVIYRKGIRVGVNSRIIYDYGFEHIEINEDRTAKNLIALSYCFERLMARVPSIDYVLSVLHTGADEIPCDEYIALESFDPNITISNKWVDISKDYMLVVREKTGKYIEEIEKTKKETLLVPQQFAKHLVKQHPAAKVLGIGRAIDNVSMTDIIATNKMVYLLNETLAVLKSMNYDVPYKISIVQFDDDTINGLADFNAKQIYLSERLFDMGRRSIALVIMEETEHIISGKPDKTREFQHHLLSSWLTTMENANGLFL